jgi:hypothetical protein
MLAEKSEDVVGPDGEPEVAAESVWLGDRS